MADNEQHIDDSLFPRPVSGGGERKLTADALASLNGDSETKPKPQDRDDGSESDLSEIDEQMFTEFDPSVNQRPVVPIDEDTVQKLGVHRRVRQPGEEAPALHRPVKSKLKRRERHREHEDEVELGATGRKAARRIRSGEGVERPVKPARVLSVEEQRLADLDDRISAAIKSKTKRRRRGDEVELEKIQDDMIVSLRDRMIAAAERDYADVKAGQAATHKIRMLPEVRAVITKPNLHVACMDNNFLVAVRRWLEPLDNKALPAYQIQKELFAYLKSFVISDAEILRETGIGKIVAFYTKDVRPQHDIKRIANILIRDWTRPVLGTSDDYSTREYATREYDPSQLSRDLSRTEEDNPLAPPPRNANRTRVPMSMPKTYDIVPKSTITLGGMRPAHNIHADELVKRVKARAMAARKGGRKSGLSIEGRGLY